MLKTSNIKSLAQILRDMKNPPVEEETVEQMDEALDPVNKVATKKKFKDRKDKDIDNDGDVDSSDKYLHKKRKAISKAMSKEEAEVVDESGHTDVASAKTQVKVAKSALQKMEMELNKLPEEGSLPTWWTNKVAIAVDKLDGMADYLDTQVEEVELVEKDVAIPASIDNLKKIVKDKQNAVFMFKDGKVRVDLFSASALVQVYDALKPATKKKFEDMIKTKGGFVKSVDFAFSMAKK